MTGRREAAACRSNLLQSVRGFFVDAGFIEVETPVRIPAPALEEHIDAVPSGDGYLRTSPELHMKRMLCEGFERIFQMGPCFRHGEKGRIHNPEYTMLEWYRAGADYEDVLQDTVGLILRLAAQLSDGHDVPYQGGSIDVTPPWRCCTVADLFIEHAGWNPLEAQDPERFDEDLIARVEPALPVDRPVIVKDYPVWASALARCKDDPYPHAERWELYMGGMEIANAFSELNDATEQRRRFEACAAYRRGIGRVVYPLDEAFLAAIEQGMPPAGGVALGIDRLAMIFADVTCIDDIQLFSF